MNQESIAARNIRIKIIGMGGAGTNVVDRLKLDNAEDVGLAAMNTDAQALAESPIEEKAMIGRSITRGLSAGGDPELGKQSAEADLNAIRDIVQGQDIIFIVAGLGGGTGSGAAPILAMSARGQESLVIAFVTMPFTLEGTRRQQIAEDSLSELRSVYDAVVPLPNDLLLQQADEQATVLDAFAQADEWISRGIYSICAMLFKTGLINLDFSSLRNAFCVQGGKSMFGLGRGSGEQFVKKALEDLALCPLLHTPEYARQADRLLVNIIGGTSLAMAQVNEIMSYVSLKFGSQADVVMGAVIDDRYHESVEICVLGTTDVEGVSYARKPTFNKLVQNNSTAQEGSQVVSPEGSDGQAPFPNDPAHAFSSDSSAPLKTEQEEFPFLADGAQRGYFDQTDRNLFEGEDLDVPTYLRKGIRIVC